MKPNQARALRKLAERARAAQSDALQEYLANGGDAHQVRPELIPTAADQARLERAIKAGAARAAKQPKGAARNRKVDVLIPMVAELCVIERVLALPPLERAALKPSDLAEMAHTGPGEMRAKLREIVAGVVGGGDTPKIEVARG